MDNVVANLRIVGGQNGYYACKNAILLYRDGLPKAQGERCVNLA